MSVVATLIAASSLAVSYCSYQSTSEIARGTIVPSLQYLPPSDRLPEDPVEIHLIVHNTGSFGWQDIQVKYFIRPREGDFSPTYLGVNVIEQSFDALAVGAGSQRGSRCEINRGAVQVAAAEWLDIDRTWASWPERRRKISEVIEENLICSVIVSAGVVSRTGEVQSMSTVFVDFDLGGDEGSRIRDAICDTICRDLDLNEFVFSSDSGKPS